MVRILAAVAVAASLSACATITRGTHQKFAVISTPDSADVEMSNGLRCRTPCKLKVARKSDIIVRVSKPGYQPAEVRVQGKVRGGGVAGGVVGNALIGGLIGLGVDSSTGAMLDLSPNPVEVTLVPVAVEAPAAPAEAAPAAAPTGDAPAAQPAAPATPAPAAAAPAAPAPAPTADAAPAPKPSAD